MKNQLTCLSRLREPAIYNAIIKAIAEGSSRAADICGKVQETSTTVLKYLKTLMDLGIVKKGNAAHRKSRAQDDLSFSR